MLAFFFSPEKEHPLRTTLMTSSKRHWGQRAVSHLVLYTNLKKKTKQQRHKGERKQRRNNFRKKQGCEFWRSGASDGSGSELANPSGLLWSPSLSGGGDMVGYGLSPQALWKFTLQEHVCVWGWVSVTVSSWTTAVPVRWVPPRLPRLPRPWTSDRNSLLSFLIGTCMKWVRWGGRLQCPLLFGRLLRGGLHSFSLRKSWIVPVESLCAKTVWVKHKLRM